MCELLSLTNLHRARRTAAGSGLNRRAVKLTSRHGPVDPKPGRRDEHIRQQFILPIPRSALMSAIERFRNSQAGALPRPSRLKQRRWATYNIQGKSKPNPNLAKLSKIEQNPAKLNQGKSLDFLVQIEPYQGLARTPQGVFSFACPLRPHRLARVEPPLPAGSLPVFHVFLVQLRPLGGLVILRRHYRTDSDNLQ